MFESFLFDNVESKQYGIVCAVMSSSSKGSENIPFDIKELSTSKSAMNDTWNIHANDYKEPISFSIGLFNYDDTYMDVDKTRDLIRWLCKENTYSFFQFYDQGIRNIWHKVIFFKPEYIMVGGQIAGLKLSAQCNSSYGYSDEIHYSFDIPASGGSFHIYNTSDQRSYLYPEVKISLPATPSTKLIITNQNDQEHRSTEIGNLFSNEIITMENADKIMTSTHPNKICMGSFNKQWIRFLQGDNRFTVNSKCSIEFKLREIRKVGVLAL